jgi:hypothetical protein
VGNLTQDIANKNYGEFHTRLEELMTSLDQVKKYRALSNSMLDLVLIITGSVIGALFVLLATNLYELFFGTFSNLAISVPAIFLSGGVFIGGIILGTLMIDHRVSRVKTGDWKDALKESEGMPEALKLLSTLGWDTIFQDIQIAKIGFLIYGFLKIAGYWLFTFFLLEILNVIILSGIVHALVNSIYLGVLALVIVLAGSWSDLKFRFRQSWSLEGLLWELRWFDNEFRRAQSDFQT